MSLTTELWDQTIPDLGTLSSLDLVRIMNAQDKTVAIAVEAALPAIAEAIDCIVARLNSGGKLFYVGAGTSGRLGILDAAECPPTFNTDPSLVQALIAGGPSAVFQAQEGAEDDGEQGAVDLASAGAKCGDVVVGISASGTTPYVLGALQWARQQGITTISLSCNERPKAELVSDITIAIDSGPEVLMGSTRLKAGTAQKMVLNMLSTGAMVGLGKTYRNLMVDMHPSNAKLRDRAVRIVMLACDIDSVAAQNLLEEANGETKVAIAMHLLQSSADDARRRLAEVGGILARLSSF
ncbi:MAG: N-acetylmuramic acid 6-phosphate etherase [Firmicutes bacterium]|nr:N-acetylmuramic acid 6-phosphate etherase [Bacillota bacterium]